MSFAQGLGKLNHIRHILMDLSMLGMAVTALVSTGGAFGFLDPLWAWLKMHVSGLPGLLAASPDFLGTAFEQAVQGTWFTGIETAGHGVHGPVVDPVSHGMEMTMHGAESATPLAREFNSRSEWFAALPATEQAHFQGMADAFGKTVEEVTRGWNTGHDALVPANW